MFICHSEVMQRVPPIRARNCTQRHSPTKRSSTVLARDTSVFLTVSLIIVKNHFVGALDCVGIRFHSADDNNDSSNNNNNNNNEGQRTPRSILPPSSIRVSARHRTRQNLLCDRTDCE